MAFSSRRYKHYKSILGLKGPQKPGALISASRKTVKGKKSAANTVKPKSLKKKAPRKIAPKKKLLRKDSEDDGDDDDQSDKRVLRHKVMCKDCGAMHMKGKHLKRKK